MAKFKDRTEDFRDAVRQSAISLGLSEAKTANVLASFIIHKPRERTSFMKSALKTLEGIEALKQFLVKHKKDYVDLHRTTVHEKDSIENEVNMFINACKDQIDIVQNMINAEEVNSKGWLGIRVDHKNADTIAHKYGVVLILSENLESVKLNFDKLRAVRVQDTINKVTPRIKRKKADKEKEPGATTKSSTIAPSDLYNTEVRESDVIQQVPPVKLQDQILDDETRYLQEELSSLLGGAQQVEAKMLEMSAMNQFLSTLVSKQAQQVEQIYDQAVRATMNIKMGNKELNQAKERNSSSRTFWLLIIAVLTFSVLFLDWYN